MGWSSQSGPPCQLEVRGRLVTKAKNIAEEMNQYFIDKVHQIRSTIEDVPNNFMSLKMS